MYPLARACVCMYIHEEQRALRRQYNLGTITERLVKLEKLAPTTLATFSRSDIELWPMTLTAEYDIIGSRYITTPKYQRSFCSKVIVRKERQTRQTDSCSSCDFMVTKTEPIIYGILNYLKITHLNWKVPLHKLLSRTSLLHIFDELKEHADVSAFT